MIKAILYFKTDSTDHYMERLIERFGASWTSEVINRKEKSAENIQRRPKFNIPKDKSATWAHFST